jgi:hypothetical protein
MNTESQNQALRAAFHRAKSPVSRPRKTDFAKRTQEVIENIQYGQIGFVYANPPYPAPRRIADSDNLAISPL